MFFTLVARNRQIQRVFSVSSVPLCFKFRIFVSPTKVSAIDLTVAALNGTPSKSRIFNLAIARSPPDSAIDVIRVAQNNANHFLRDGASLVVVNNPDDAASFFML